MTDLEKARACMAQIPAARCDYEQWLAVGMALKDAGGAVAEWDAWSRSDDRYRAGECERKWRGFNGGGAARVGVGSVIQLCRDMGGNPPADHRAEDAELSWDDYIGRDQTPKAADDYKVVSEWTADLPVPATAQTPVQQFAAYLGALFHTEDVVGVVTECWKTPADKDGKTGWAPRKGDYSRTAGELIERLSRAKDLGEVVGDWEPTAGAWCRFNPLDGQGVADSNVKAFRFALVESDEVPIERQHAIIRELNLPVAALVHSGGKSLHAIVRIEAADYREYQQRVDFLYGVCAKNGLIIDRKNRNPSRLSRLPGATRNGRIQQLVAVNVGLSTWAEWTDWISAQNDDLPEVECLADFIEHPPQLAPPLIDGVLRQGHKMLLAGPSKAGKSFLLLQLAVAIAEGQTWLGRSCAPGRVLYVNLELDRATLYTRLKDVYGALGIPPANVAAIDAWNLRGKATPMTDLAPRLIRRALKKRAAGIPYTAVIIDPIYKVITGDENAADQMAKFCNQFDRVCHELGAAVIYCHHHSKGAQGQKAAHDRASGSGVFARDPDALLDMIELEIDNFRARQVANRWRCAALSALLDRECPGWREDCPQDDAIVDDRLLAWAVAQIGPEAPGRAWAASSETAESATAWRIEGILREFRTPPPFRMFFRYPIHLPDADGILADAKAEGELPTAKDKEEAIRRKQGKIDADMQGAFDALDENGPVMIKDVAEYLSIGESTVKDRITKGEDRGSKLRYKGQVVYVCEK